MKRKFKVKSKGDVLNAMFSSVYSAGCDCNIQGVGLCSECRDFSALKSEAGGEKFEAISVDGLIVNEEVNYDK